MCNDIATKGRLLLLKDRVACNTLAVLPQPGNRWHRPGPGQGADSAPPRSTCSETWNSLFFKDGCPARDHLFLSVGSISIYGFTYLIIHPVFIHRRTKVFDKASIPVYLKALYRASHLHQRSSLRNEADPVGLLWVPVKYLKLAQRNRKHF
jgi:hypothetical protein